MKAVVGEEALSPEELGFIDFLENFERKFISQVCLNNVMSNYREDMKTEPSSNHSILPGNF